MTRRQFLSSAVAAIATNRTAAALVQRTPAGGRLIGTLPLGDPGRPSTPLDRLLGISLDARLFTDLSSLTRESLITRADRFFVRTAAPPSLPDAGAWTVALGGDVREPRTLALAALRRLAAPMGAHLLECAGNTDANNYGLIGAAAWDGVPIGRVLDDVRPVSRSHRILVSGVDDEAYPSRTSIAGASWIFSREDLETARAFLALRMNGAPLGPHHGAPVRLVVPGWYGCACIKWVDRIDVVSDEAEATSQMREYAARTHQAPGVRLARDFSPAVIDTAAMPIRVEHWRLRDRHVYRVVGVMWGGSKPTNALQIRFSPTGPWIDVDDCPLPASTATWSIWTHTWRPDAPGRHQIVLRVNDPAIRTRRLDLFFYIREVDITDV